MGGEKENVLSESESALTNVKKEFPGFNSEQSQFHSGTIPRHASQLPFAILYETRSGGIRAWKVVTCLCSKGLNFALTALLGTT